MLYKKIHAFTLVELIVVITLLAILTTIAFVSYGYIIGNSKNTTVKSHVNQLSHQISIGKTEGIDMFAFIEPLPGNQLTHPSIGGEDTNVGVDYSAGRANYTAIGIKAIEEDSTADYRIGATKKLRSKFEIGGVIITSIGTEQAFIEGTYDYRTTDSTTSKVLSIGTGDIFFLEINNGFKTGDIISSSGATSIQTKITKIESTSIPFNKIYTQDPIPGSTTHIMLAIDETSGLIMGEDSNAQTGTVINLGEILPY